MITNMKKKFLGMNLPRDVNVIIMTKKDVPIQPYVELAEKSIRAIHYIVV